MAIEIAQTNSEPCPCPAGDDLTVTCKVVCNESSVTSVKVTIPPFGDFDLYDDGTRGDAVAGDGTYSRRETIPFLAPRGKHELKVTARSDQGETASGTVEVEIS